MTQSPKNFILLVEMLERELPASVLLGSELVSRGHNVWLIEKGRFRKSPASFAPSIVLRKPVRASDLLMVLRSLTRG